MTVTCTATCPGLHRRRRRESRERRRRVYRNAVQLWRSLAIISRKHDAASSTHKRRRSRGSQVARCCTLKQKSYRLTFSEFLARAVPASLHPRSPQSRSNLFPKKTNYVHASPSIAQEQRRLGRRGKELNAEPQTPNLRARRSMVADWSTGRKSARSSSPSSSSLLPPSSSTSSPLSLPHQAIQLFTWIQPGPRAPLPSSTTLLPHLAEYVYYLDSNRLNPTTDPSLVHSRTNSGLKLMTRTRCAFVFCKSMDRHKYLFRLSNTSLGTCRVLCNETREVHRCGLPVVMVARDIPDLRRMRDSDKEGRSRDKERARPGSAPHRLYSVRLRRRLLITSRKHDAASSTYKRRSRESHEKSGAGAGLILRESLARRSCRQPSAFSRPARSSVLPLSIASHRLVSLGLLAHQYMLNRPQTPNPPRGALRLRRTETATRKSASCAALLAVRVHSTPASDGLEDTTTSPIFFLRLSLGIDFLSHRAG
ncbi:hypothetical protein C8R45DRAFT_932022 [Mycena sanguinolenta]|nr:hypothetical protein C8R45DRAFT_932022 [Mycena sanguinolenta]